MNLEEAQNDKIPCIHNSDRKRPKRDNRQDLNAVFRHNINIEDLDQKVMEGYFVMTMLVDMSDSTLTIAELKKELSVIEDEMGLKIQVQHENIFQTMHRV